MIVFRRRTCRSAPCSRYWSGYRTTVSAARLSAMPPSAGAEVSQPCYCFNLQALRAPEVQSRPDAARRTRNRRILGMNTLRPKSARWRKNTVTGWMLIQRLATRWIFVNGTTIPLVVGDEQRVAADSDALEGLEANRGTPPAKVIAETTISSPEVTRGPSGGPLPEPLRTSRRCKRQSR